MTDAKLILDFLEKNYEVTIGYDNYNITDKESQATYSHSKHSTSQFNKVFTNLFGHFNVDDSPSSSFDTLNDWFDKGSRIIGKKLNDYFQSYDGTLGSKAIFFDLKDRFGTEMNTSFLSKEFIKDYKTRWLEPSLNKYLESMDMGLGSIISLEKILSDYEGDVKLFNQYIIDTFNNHYDRHLSVIVVEYLSKFSEDTTLQEFLDGFEPRLNTETELHRYGSSKLIKDWYRVNILDDKLIPLFREFVITMGDKDWKVTWIGHGPLTEEKLLSQFQDEKKYNREYILQRYEDWFAEEVIDASERYLKKAW
jgi:hypothetical protein